MSEDIKAEIARLEKELAEVKGTPCEVWSRIVGYFRPRSCANPGKLEEMIERVPFEINPKRFEK